MAFIKIKETDKTGKKITELSDTPQISGEEAKARFDALPELAIQFLNNLIDNLVENTAAESIGAKAPEGVTAQTGTVQAVINAVAKLITDNKSDYDSIVKLLTGINEISNTVKNSASSIPTGKAIASYVSSIGGGDMMKSVYDSDDSGVVDNSERLGGKFYDEYQEKEDKYFDTNSKNVTGAVNEVNGIAKNNKSAIGIYTFDNTRSYAVGDYCIYNNIPYRFIEGKDIGEWDSYKVVQTNIESELKYLLSKIKSNRNITLLCDIQAIKITNTTTFELSESYKNFKEVLFAVKGRWSNGTDYWFAQKSLFTECLNTGEQTLLFTIRGSSNYLRADVTFNSDTQFLLKGSTTNYDLVSAKVYGIS